MERIPLYLQRPLLLLGSLWSNFQEWCQCNWMRPCKPQLDGTTLHMWIQLRVKKSGGKCSIGTKIIAQKCWEQHRGIDLVTEKPASTGMILHCASPANHTNGICKGLSDGPLCSTQMELVLVTAPTPPAILIHSMPIIRWLGLIKSWKGGLFSKLRYKGGCTVTS